MRVYYTGKRVQGYGLYILIPGPAVPGGYKVFPIYVPAGQNSCPNPYPNGDLPAGCAGNGYPLPSLPSSLA